MKNYDKERLIDEFIENAIIQGEATYSGDYKKGNKASDKLFKIGRIMEQNIDVAKNMLDTILYHENINVRIWAAGKAIDLDYKKDEAIEVLEKISVMPDAGILGFNAEMSLKVRREKGIIK